MSGLPVSVLAQPTNPSTNPNTNFTEASMSAGSNESIPFSKSSSAEAAAQAASAASASKSRDAETSAEPPQSELLNRVVQGAHDAIDKLADHAAPHVQRLQATVSQTGEKLQAQAHQARQTGDEWTEALRKTVREKPLASVATAVVIGVLLAKLTS